MRNITFAAFKAVSPVQRYTLEAYEDIPGFARQGDPLYGNCDDLIVRDFTLTQNSVMRVWLGMPPITNCSFCQDHEGTPRQGYMFYAGYAKQLKEDEFDEHETEDINYCPLCGRKLRGEA